MITIVQGDCLEKLKKVESASVDLVLCDPPFGTIKGLDIRKNDPTTNDWDTQIETRPLFKELLRVVKFKGQVILFSQEPYTSHLRSQSLNGFTFCYPMIYKKSQYGNPLSCKKAMLNYFEDLSLWVKDYDVNLQSPLRCYFRTIAKRLDLNMGKVNKIFNHRKYEHTFYFNSVQFELCNEALYQAFCDKFNLYQYDFYKPYHELKALQVPKFKTFNLGNKKHLSNVLEFKKPTKTLHPTQKPVDLLEHLIKTFSNKNDTVLDFAMGSGSTGEACIKTNRNFIGVELDSKFFDIAHKRLKNYVKSVELL